MKNISKYLIVLGVILTPMLFKVSQTWVNARSESAYTQISNIWQYTHLPLPLGYSSFFAASGQCEVCHGYDTAHIASVDLLGNDINLVDDWRSSMMGNAARDPFWQAKVSHEVSVYPEAKEEIESVCTTCHAPMARYNGILEGQPHLSMEEMRADPLGMDGVSCLACHKQSEERLGDEHSGVLHFVPAKIAYGPYESPLNSPMVQETGYTPLYSPHIEDSGICAGCHSLLTPSVDLDGIPTGQTFVEQATYHEWLNSIYNDAQSCQSCHMPVVPKGDVFLVAGYETEPRSLFSKHSFVGANTFMLQLLRDNIDSLGLTASEEQFNESIGKSNDMLLNHSVELEMELQDRTLDTAVVEVKIKNITGHKFPSGYPSRRAFLKLTVETEDGTIIFNSGAWDDNYEVIGQDPFYEPHYDTIRAEDQVQIYEMVVANVEGQRTTVLEQMAYPLKDNRLVPAGFTTAHEVYDTVAITGNAATDPNFNQEEGEEGSGIDKIYYHIPLNGMVDVLNVTAQVYYQTAPPRWMEEMLATNTPEVSKFKGMFEQADKMPIKVKEKKITLDLFVGTHEPAVAQAWFEEEYLHPIEGVYGIYTEVPTMIDIYNIEGKCLQHYDYQKGHIALTFKDKQGIVLVKFQTKEGQIYTKKLLF